MNMKRMKTAMVALLVVGTAVFSTGCGDTEGNSGENPIPTKYVGYYSHSQCGKIYVSQTDVSSDGLFLPQCVVGGKDKYGVTWRWNPTTFDYKANSTGASVSFSPYMYDAIGSESGGTANFSANVEEKDYTYNINLFYYPNKTMILARNK